MVALKAALLMFASAALGSSLTPAQRTSEAPRQAQEVAGTLDPESLDSNVITAHLIDKTLRIPGSKKLTPDGGEVWTGRDVNGTSAVVARHGKGISGFINTDSGNYEIGGTRIVKLRTPPLGPPPSCRLC